ncbi:MAG: FkbM family methyltransferase [Bryobacteraceae bacterium]
MKTSRIILIVAVLAMAGAAAFEFSPSFRLWALVAAGRSPVCPASLAVKSHANVVEKTIIKDRILAGSHLLKEESGLELWDTPKGQYWIPKGNRYVLPFNLAEMEQHIYGTGQHFIHPGDIVLDCGASDGDFTRVALAAGAKLVVSIEISPSSAECIRRNTAAEAAAGRVIVYPKGVWNKEDVMMLNVDDTNFAANSVVMRPETGHPSVQVPLTTIDKLVTELKLPRVDFIKMDIEGAEIPALSGGHDTIANFKPRLAIATEHKPDDEYTIPAAVKKIRPDYRMECGPCLEGDGRVRPDVLYFY